MTTTTLPHYTSPLRVPEVSGQKDSNHVYFARWEKYNALPEETQHFLESEETAATIYKIQKFRNLSDETTANIARVVRSYYFGDLKEFDFVPYLLRDDQIDQAAAARLSQLIIKEIIEAQPNETNAQHRSDQEAKEQQSLPLLEALSLYPKLNDHVLTTQPFSSAEDSQKNPQKGTIKNWIFDYHMSNRGKARRTLTDRDRYLEDSPNARDLSGEDRKKVALVLASFDEGTPIEINTKNKEIIFDLAPEEMKEKKEKPSIGGGISKRTGRKPRVSAFRDKFREPENEKTRPVLKHDEVKIPLNAKAVEQEDAPAPKISKEALHINALGQKVDPQQKPRLQAEERKTEEESNVTASETSAPTSSEAPQENDELTAVNDPNTHSTEEFAVKTDEQAVEKTASTKDSHTVTNSEDGKSISDGGAQELVDSPTQEEAVPEETASPAQEIVSPVAAQKEKPSTSAKSTKSGALHPQDMYSPAENDANTHEERSSEEPHDLMDVNESLQTDHTRETQKESPAKKDTDTPKAISQDKPAPPREEMEQESHNETAEKDITQDAVTPTQTSTTSNSQGNEDDRSSEEVSLPKKSRPKRSPFSMKPIE